MRHLTALLTLCLLATAAQANTAAMLTQADCSAASNLSIDAGVLVFSCGGDLTALSGSLSADTSISISATGNLSVDNLVLEAPLITIGSFSGSITLGSHTTFISNGDIVIGPPTPGGVSIQPGANLSLIGRDVPGTNPPGGSIEIRQGSQISLYDPNGTPITLSVPEPSPLAMLTVGSLLLALRARRRS